MVVSSRSIGAKSVASVSSPMERTRQHVTVIIVMLQAIMIYKCAATQSSK